jgi:hypothetical protein
MGREDITDWLIHFTRDIYKKEVVDVWMENESEGKDTNDFIFDYSNQLPDATNKYSTKHTIKVL